MRDVRIPAHAPERAFLEFGVRDWRIVFMGVEEGDGMFVRGGENGPLVGMGMESANVNYAVTFVVIIGDGPLGRGDGFVVGVWDGEIGRAVWVCNFMAFYSEDLHGYMLDTATREEWE
jgi:hypothetical protein